MPRACNAAANVANAVAVNAGATNSNSPRAGTVHRVVPGKAAPLACQACHSGAANKDMDTPGQHTLPDKISSMPNRAQVCLAGPA